jgi:hypothetical protein
LGTVQKETKGAEGEQADGTSVNSERKREGGSFLDDTSVHAQKETIISSRNKVQHTTMSGKHWE